MEEIGLVGGKEGGTAECPKEEEVEFKESTGFDKDFGDEFDHVFEDKDDDGNEDDKTDECMMELPPEEEEEAEIVVKVNEGLFDKRNKLLYERLTKWSSK